MIVSSIIYIEGLSNLVHFDNPTKMPMEVSSSILTDFDNDQRLYINWWAVYLKDVHNIHKLDVLYFNKLNADVACHGCQNWVPIHPNNKNFLLLLKKQKEKLTNSEIYGPTKLIAPIPFPSRK